MAGFFLAVASLQVSCIKYQPHELNPVQTERQFRARTLANPGLASFGHAQAGLGELPWPPAKLTPETLTWIAYYFHPAIEASRAKVAAADAAVQTAGQRVNPALSAEGGYNKTPDSVSTWAVSPAFTIETAGKRGYRILEAQKLAEAARIAVWESAWQVRGELRKALTARWAADSKLELLREMGLPEHAMDRPLLGIVSRFATQKGFDIMRDMAWELLRDDVYLVVLGNGEHAYEEMFRWLTRHFPDKVGLRIGYNDGLAHRIEAGSDMFLMPSHYEPCGLNQIYSLKYGTVPVVRATGGLDDTIIDQNSPESTGYKFNDYTGSALLGTTRAACHEWYNREAWTAMMIRGMKQDFSWATSATEYSRLFQSLHPATA